MRYRFSPGARQEFIDAVQWYLVEAGSTIAEHFDWAVERALGLLEKLGIFEQADKLPSDLSGGQQQRAAIARALANDPPLLVADEPTGNLDSKTSEDVMQLFAALVKEGKTVVMVTHERDFGRYFTRTINLADGVILPEQLEVGV